VQTMIRIRPSLLLARIVAWTLAAILLVLSVVPPDLRPETGVPHYFEHFLAYGVTGAAFCLGYERKPNLLSVYLLIFCAVIEILQLFVPGRHARLADFATDAIAACVGIAIVSSITRLYSQRTPTA
jgi:VanZ family protein